MHCRNVLGEEPCDGPGILFAVSPIRGAGRAKRQPLIRKGEKKSKSVLLSSGSAGTIDVLYA